MNNKANTNIIDTKEGKIFKEDYALPESNTALTHVEKDGLVIDSFQYKSYDKDGNMTIKSTKNAVTMSVVNSVSFFAQMGKLSTKAIAIECARVTKAVIKAEGYKTPAEMLHSIFPDLSANTINQYRRVGMFFGVREVNEQGKVTYRYRTGIDEGVAITNLTQVISLANLPDNIEDLKKEEIDKLYIAFYNNYIESGRINLNLSQSDLKKQIKEVVAEDNAIETTGIVKSVEAQEQPTEAEEQPTEAKTTDTVFDSPKKTATEAVTALNSLFKGNTAVLRLLAKIAEQIETLPDNVEAQEQPTEAQAQEEPKKAQEEPKEAQKQ